MMQQDDEIKINPRIADVIPRKSGEPIFHSPWEKRAFGMAVALCDKGLVPFDDLRWRVAAAISTWERANAGQELKFSFFERWLLALERLVIDRGLISREELSRRAAESSGDTR
jgi:nitrile hydratase accessory protein